MKNAQWILVVISVIDWTAATPIFVEDIQSFEDPWDYKLPPHRDPILQHESSIHELPSRIERMSKEYDDDSALAKHVTAPSAMGPMGIKLSCSGCKLGISLLKSEVSQTSDFDEIKERFVSICVGFKIENEIVCSGIFDMYGPVVLPALKLSQIDTDKICNLLLGETCGSSDNQIHNWFVELNDTDNVNKDVWSTPPPSDDVPTFKVLHLSDTHFDPLYQEGSPANCQEPLCCRSFSTPPEKQEVVPAGKYGAYEKCDSPQILFETMLEHIALEHPDIDYIIWTGDIPPHDVWNQSKADTLSNIKFTINQLVEAFPDVPIFPALGNHEGVPAGNFPPPWIKSENQSISWLYNVIAEEWSKWLPQEINSTLLHGGFYSVLIRPKFRLISLNMNYCYSLSWWLVLNSTDPAKELKWLIHELQMAEDNNEKVHIIGHVPPGGADCLKMWSKNYYDIINRYKNTVVAQFFGHTHSDEFELFYNNKNTSEAIGVAYIGPAVTPFELMNPGYRIYYVNGDHPKSTYEVIDHETWITDLQRANAHPHNTPTYFKLYSARSAYDMATLRPKDWDNLVNTMVHDKKVFNLFHKYFYKASPVRPYCNDNECKYKVICDLKTGKSNARKSLCHREEAILLNNSTST